VIRPDYFRAVWVADGRMSDDRLSQHERVVLEVLEQTLALDDPAFVVGFAAEARALDGRRGRRWHLLRWLQRWRNGEPDL
jgi:hypothetical protein